MEQRRVEAAEDGSLSHGEIFSNEAVVSDSDHLPEGPWVPSDAREAQRISGKSVTSPRQGMASQACKPPLRGGMLRMSWRYAPWSTRLVRFQKPGAEGLRALRLI